MVDQVPVFVAEIAPKNLRGGLTAMNQVTTSSLNKYFFMSFMGFTLSMQLMICCGMTTTFIVGTFVTWRNLVLTGKLQIFF